MEFSRQEYWSGLPFPSPKELPNPGIELWAPVLQADSLPVELLESFFCIWVFFNCGGSDGKESACDAEDLI